MVFRVWLPLVCLDCGSLNPSGNFAPRISWQKGDLVTSIINSSLCSSITTMAYWRSQRDVSYPMRNNSLLPHLSNGMLRTLMVPSPIQSVPKVCPFPSLLNIFPDALLSSSLPICTLLVCPLDSIEAGMWERATSALGLTPVHWVSIALGISPIYCTLTSYQVTTHPLPAYCPLVASFLFMLIDADSYGEYSGLWHVSPFEFEDLYSSHLVCWLLCGSGCCWIWEHRFCVSCIKLASIRSTVARIVSMFYST